MSDDEMLIRALLTGYVTHDRKGCHGKYTSSPTATMNWLLGQPWFAIYAASLPSPESSAINLRTFSTLNPLSALQATGEYSFGIGSRGGGLSTWQTHTSPNTFGNGFAAAVV